MEERIKTMIPLLNECRRRIFLDGEAMPYGWGSIQKVSEISGVSTNTSRIYAINFSMTYPLKMDETRASLHVRCPLPFQG